MLVPGTLPCDLVDVDADTAGSRCDGTAEFILWTHRDEPGESTKTAALAVCEPHLVPAVRLAHQPHKITPADVRANDAGVVITTTSGPRFETGLEARP